MNEVSSSTPSTSHPNHYPNQVPCRTFPLPQALGFAHSQILLRAQTRHIVRDHMCIHPSNTQSCSAPFAPYLRLSLCGRRIRRQRHRRSYRVPLRDLCLGYPTISLRCSVKSAICGIGDPVMILMPT